MQTSGDIALALLVLFLVFSTITIIVQFINNRTENNVRITKAIVKSIELLRDEVRAINRKE